jgi:hypothetical protein
MAERKLLDQHDRLVPSRQMIGRGRAHCTRANDNVSRLDALHGDAPTLGQEMGQNWSARSWPGSS